MTLFDPPPEPDDDDKKAEEFHRAIADINQRGRVRKGQG